MTASHSTETYNLQLIGTELIILSELDVGTDLSDGADTEIDKKSCWFQSHTICNEAWTKFRGSEVW